MKDTHVSHVRDILQSALAMDDQAKLAEAQATADQPEYRKTRDRDCIAKKLAMHNPKHRKIGIEATRDAEGIPIHNRDQAHAFLGQYWGGKFKEAEIDEQLAEEFAGQYSSPLPRVQWVMPFLDFLLLMMAPLKASAGGPDGIAYGAWACCLHAKIILFSACMMWLRTGYVPIFSTLPIFGFCPKPLLKMVYTIHRIQGLSAGRTLMPSFSP